MLHSPKRVPRAPAPPTSSSTSRHGASCCPRGRTTGRRGCRASRVHSKFKVGFEFRLRPAKLSPAFFSLSPSSSLVHFPLFECRDEAMMFPSERGAGHRPAMHMSGGGHQSTFAINGYNEHQYAEARVIPQKERANLESSTVPRGMYGDPHEWHPLHRGHQATGPKLESATRSESAKSLAMARARAMVRDADRRGGKQVSATARDPRAHVPKGRSSQYNYDAGFGEALYATKVDLHNTDTSAAVQKRRQIEEHNTQRRREAVQKAMAQAADAKKRYTSGILPNGDGPTHAPPDQEHVPLTAVSFMSVGGTRSAVASGVHHTSAGGAKSSRYRHSPWQGESRDTFLSKATVAGATTKRAVASRGDASTMWRPGLGMAAIGEDAAGGGAGRRYNPNDTMAGTGVAINKETRMNHHSWGQNCILNPQ